MEREGNWRVKGIYFRSKTEIYKYVVGARTHQESFIPRARARQLYISVYAALLAEWENDWCILCGGIHAVVVDYKYVRAAAAAAAAAGSRLARG